MESLNVVLLQGNPATAQSLIAPLSNAFHSVQSARSLDELKHRVAKQHARVAVVDMEVASLKDVETLSQEFPDLSIVCNHRLADDNLWTATLNAGAADCFDSYDVNGILRAAVRQASAREAA
jgi:DNA-binding NarL/FixJ family response regulator